MEIAVMRDDSEGIRQTIETHHYLRRWPDPRSLPFGYRLIIDGSSAAGDGRPHGIVVFKKPQHHKQKGLFGYDGLPTAWQVLDLARVWVHPDWQRHENGHALSMFSRMVSKALKVVQRDWLEHHPPRYPELPYHIELVISYCELLHHEGIGYRASNFKSIGKTSDSTKELYAYWLKSPRWKWMPETHPEPIQKPLLAEMPLRYGN